MSGLRRILSFPNPVNEVAARFVAGMVVILSIVTILVGHPLAVFGSRIWLFSKSGYRTNI